MLDERVEGVWSIAEVRKDVTRSVQSKYDKFQLAEWILATLTRGLTTDCCFDCVTQV